MKRSTNTPSSHNVYIVTACLSFLYCSVGLSCLLVVNRYIAELQEAEEQAMVLDKEPIYPPFPRDELMQGAKRGGINSCLDWSTQCIRSILDWLATQHLSTDLSNKLRKGKLVFCDEVFLCLDIRVFIPHV